LRHLKGDNYEPSSAGTFPTRVHPGAIEALKEIGIDTTSLRSKSATEFIGERFDLVVTVCDRAKESCPFFPGALRTIHSGFTDPEELIAKGKKSEEAFRIVRDDIRAWLLSEFA